MGVYRLSRKAAADIDGIYTYTIEQHGLALARKYLNSLHTCFEHLAEHPMLGRRAGIAPGARRHECQSHVVFYVPDSAGVRIARVLHARMDAPRRYVKESPGAAYGQPAGISCVGRSAGNDRGEGRS